jgi:hypothetical protein
MFGQKRLAFSEGQKLRLEFGRLADAAFGHEMMDHDRGVYWEMVLEPVWRGLQAVWRAEGYPSGPELENAIRDALGAVESPSQFRARQPPRKAKAAWREEADKKAAKEVKRLQAKRRYVNEVLGQKEKKAEPNSRAFWQSQSFGPASPVRQIDPATYKLDED